MAKKKTRKCKYGKLSKPVRERGKLRYCKMNPKKRTGKSASAIYSRRRRVLG